MNKEKILKDIETIFETLGKPFHKEMIDLEETKNHLEETASAMSMVVDNIYDYLEKEDK